MPRKDDAEKLGSAVGKMDILASRADELRAARARLTASLMEGESPSDHGGGVGRPNMAHAPASVRFFVTIVFFMSWFSATVALTPSLRPYAENLSGLSLGLLAAFLGVTATLLATGALSIASGVARRVSGAPPSTGFIGRRLRGMGTIVELSFAAIWHGALGRLFSGFWFTVFVLYGLAAPVVAIVSGVTGNHGPAIVLVVVGISGVVVALIFVTINFLTLSDDALIGLMDGFERMVDNFDAPRARRQSPREIYDYRLGPALRSFSLSNVRGMVAAGLYFDAGRSLTIGVAASVAAVVLPPVASVLSRPIFARVARSLLTLRRLLTPFRMIPGFLAVAAVAILKSASAIGVVLHVALFFLIQRALLPVIWQAVAGDKAGLFPVVVAVGIWMLLLSLWAWVSFVVLDSLRSAWDLRILFQELNRDDRDARRRVRVAIAGVLTAVVVALGSVAIYQSDLPASASAASSSVKAWAEGMAGLAVVGGEEVAPAVVKKVVDEGTEKPRRTKARTKK